MTWWNPLTWRKKQQPCVHEDEIDWGLILEELQNTVDGLTFQAGLAHQEYQQILNEYRIALAATLLHFGDNLVIPGDVLEMVVNENLVPMYEVKDGNHVFSLHKVDEQEQSEQLEVGGEGD